MSQEIKPGQSGSSLQKDQKADAERKEPREQPKADKPKETGSSSNAVPGSGPG
jgi:hypothetical protein